MSPKTNNSNGKSKSRRYVQFEDPKASEAEKPNFERADYGRQLAALLRQKIFAQLTPELQEALKVSEHLLYIQDQVAPSDFYRVPKPKVSRDCLEDEIDKAEYLLTGRSIGDPIGLPEGYEWPAWKKKELSNKS